MSELTAHEDISVEHIQPAVLSPIEALAAIRKLDRYFRSSDNQEILHLLKKSSFYKSKLSKKQNKNFQFSCEKILYYTLQCSNAVLLRISEVCLRIACYHNFSRSCLRCSEPNICVNTMLSGKVD